MAFNHSFRIYVPSTVSVDQPVNNSAAVAGCLSFLSGLFGGATALNASGAWVALHIFRTEPSVTVIKNNAGWDTWVYTRETLRRAGYRI